MNRRHGYLLAATCVATLTSCGATSSVREPDEYLGCATDEHWRTFDDRELSGMVTIDDAQAPLVISPTTGAMLPVTSRPTITWQLSSTLSGRPNGNAVCADRCAICGQHEPPVSGDVYDVQFSTDGVLRWRALTTLQSFQPSAAAWALFKGKTVSLRLERMELKANDPQAGPFQARTPLSFTVGN